MLRKVVARVYLAILALAMVAAAVSVFPSSTALANDPIIDDTDGTAAATCCVTSADCPGTKLCYLPAEGLANCSPGSHNYCR